MCFLGFLVQINKQYQLFCHGWRQQTLIKMLLSFWCSIKAIIVIYLSNLLFVVSWLFFMAFIRGVIRVWKKMWFQVCYASWVPTVCLGLYTSCWGQEIKHQLWVKSSERNRAAQRKQATWVLASQGRISLETMQWAKQHLLKIEIS